MVHDNAAGETVVLSLICGHGEMVAELHVTSPRRKCILGSSIDRLGLLLNPWRLGGRNHMRAGLSLSIFTPTLHRVTGCSAPSSWKHQTP